MLPLSSGAAPAAAMSPPPSPPIGFDLDRVIQHIFAAGMHLRDASGGPVSRAMDELDAAVQEAYAVAFKAAEK